MGSLSERLQADRLVRRSTEKAWGRSRELACQQSYMQNRGGRQLQKEAPASALAARRISGLARPVQDSVCEQVGRWSLAQGRVGKLPKAAHLGIAGLAVASAHLHVYSWHCSLQLRSV